MSPAPVRALSIHADYGCRMSGACCRSGWAIGVDRYEGLDVRDSLPPLLRPGVLLDWPSFEHFEDPGAPP